MAGTHPKLGGKVADIVVRALGDHQRRRHPELVRLAMAIQHEFFNLTGSEHKATTGGMFDQLLATGLLRGWSADTVEFLAHGHGQWQTLLAGQATGMAMGGGLMSLLQNEFAPAIQAALAGNPHGLLAPADLAGLVARNRLDMDTGLHEAGKSGLAGVNFERMVRLNYASPAVQEAAELFVRGEIDHATYVYLLQHTGYDPTMFDYPAILARQLLSPQELASLVTFGAIDQAAARTRAAKAGMDGDSFDLLVYGNGMPPSTTDLLFAYRRGIIDKARLNRGITQGPVRNEWFDVIESLGFTPMSTADAIEAAVQGHLSYDQAKVIATQNGLRAEDFDPMYQTAGSPPGAEAMIGFWRRGFIGESEVRQALTETRLKPKYVDLLLATKPALLPMVSIRQAYEHGAMTHDRAVTLLGQHGYAAEDANAILMVAKGVKTATARKLTEGQVIELYTDLAITADAASSMLAAIGYTPDEVQWLIELADLQRQRRLTDAAIGAVHTAYVSHRIGLEQVQADLDVLLVPHDRQAFLLELWDLERAANVKTLSLAQCQAALKKGFIDGAEFGARVSAMGYPDNDVTILAQLTGVPAGG